MNELRMAVLGVGSLGQHHARILAGFDDVDLVAVVDKRPEQGRQIANRFGTLWYAAMEQLPSDLHGVVVATPTICHLETAAHFLRAGVPTLVEKPLAESLAAARQLAKLAQETDTLLQVGHVERFNPAFEAAQKRCGEPLYLRFQRVSPYTFRSTDIGVVHDLMIHDIDLALALTGQMPESVEAFGATIIGPHEDCAVARLRMLGGTVVDITSSRMAPVAERSMQVWSTNGCLSVDLQTRQLRCWEPATDFAANPSLIHAIAATTPNPLTLKNRVFQEWIPEETFQANDGDALTAELQEFTACLRGNAAPRISGEEAVRALQVAEEVLQDLTIWSCQDGKQSGRRAA